MADPFDSADAGQSEAPDESQEPDLFDFDPEDSAWGDPEPVEPHPRWRRRLITAVGVLVAVAMLAGPVWNIVDRASPPVSDSGLELCGFDYCIVQDAVRDAGLGVTMSRLANTYLAEEEARAFAEALIEYLGVDPVTVEVVDHLERRIAGQYDTADRHITLERPTRAWIVLHEVAHAADSGHGEDFQETVIELADRVGRESP